MENRSHALIAGLFTLLLGIATLLALWWFGGKHEVTRDYLVVTNKNISGIADQRSRRTRSSSSRIRQAAPTLMAQSATLKAGKCQPRR